MTKRIVAATWELPSLARPGSSDISAIAPSRFRCPERTQRLSPPARRPSTTVRTCYGCTAQPALKRLEATGQSRGASSQLARSRPTSSPQRHLVQSPARCSIWSSSVVGREPGIDDPASNDGHGNLAHDTVIRVVDFASENVVQHDVRQNDLENFLKTHQKPDWAACRWIYVNGLNQDTVQCLGRSNGLHQLALEDVLEKGTPVKADWYDNHCFMVLALQKLERLARNSRRKRAEVEPAQTFRNASHQNRAHGRANARIYHFQEQPFAMDVEQAFMFLTTNNTVITIFERSGEDVYAPIMRRLQSPQTVMRSSNDPSMLVQGIIDTVVDLSIPIGKAVGGAFSELEEAVLTQPAISQSKQLYVLRSGLTILMDNISANGTVVRELISHRSADYPKDPQVTGVPYKHSVGVVISPTAQVYLQDVQDHIRTLANSIHMSIRSAENLTSLIFNTIAASQNESVRQLTLISCFFLPLTFLTGYFGMNFDPMPVVNEHSDAFFWWIATPMIAGMSLLMLSRTMWIRSRAWTQRKRRR